MLMDVLQQIWNWITTNITMIKDLLWIVFTFVATLVAFLTYRRARFTLLQPLRTEVIKRQTDLLVELLAFLHDDGVKFFLKADYMGIIACNSYFIMKDYGFVLKNDDFGENIKANTCGLIILKESGQLSSVELPKLFEQEKGASNEQEDLLAKSAEKYRLAKQGVVELEYLHLTKQFVDCEQKLEYFINNPFMPSSIQKLLKELYEEIQYNLKVVMKSTLEEFVTLLCNKSNDLSENKPLSVQYQAIYNNFQRKSKHHDTNIEKMREITRDYLMVDKKWN